MMEIRVFVKGFCGENDLNSRELPINSVGLRRSFVVWSAGLGFLARLYKWRLKGG